MSLIATRIITPPLTLDEARRHARIDPDVSDDLLLQMMIGAVAAIAQQETGRSIALTEWQLTLDVFPSGEIALPCPPVVSIVSVQYVDEAGFLQQLPPVSYVLDAKGAPGWLLPARDTTWPATSDTANAVTVTYQAGYGEACPDAIKLWMSAQLAQSNETRSASVSGAISPMPYIDRLLDAYRLWRV